MIAIIVNVLAHARATRATSAHLQVTRSACCCCCCCWRANEFVRAVGRRPRVVLCACARFVAHNISHVNFFVMSPRRPHGHQRASPARALQLKRDQLAYALQLIIVLDGCRALSTASCATITLLLLLLLARPFGRWTSTPQTTAQQWQRHSAVVAQLAQESSGRGRAAL